MSSEPAPDKNVASRSYSSRLGSVADESIQIITSAQRIKLQYLSLVRNAQSEILLIFPTANAIRREENIGIFAELRRASERNVSIRILTPEDDFVRAQLEELRSIGIIVKQIEAPTETKFKLLVVDKKFSLIIETRDDSKATFEQAVGLATFSNSNSTVMPYVTIFKSFWRETDLYEKAREADRIKDEFVNTAAHELRNPITPIIASADFALDEVKQLKEGKIDLQILNSLSDNMQIIVRNASKLYRLSEDILQVCRIESGTFGLNIEQVDLKLMLDVVIQDAEKKIENENKLVDLHLDYRLKNNAKGEFPLFCDSYKINQVLYNLLDNAIKFTDKGGINISAAMYDPTGVIVEIEDSGTGIDPEIKDRLFVKFATKSNGGTGLGLYLAKKIIEAHGGRIWGTNKLSGAGAIFSFMLPTDLRPMSTTYRERLAEMESHIDLDKHAKERAAVE